MVEPDGGKRDDARDEVDRDSGAREANDDGARRESTSGCCADDDEPVTDAAENGVRSEGDVCWTDETAETATPEASRAVAAARAGARPAARERLDEDEEGPDGVARDGAFWCSVCAFTASCESDCSASCLPSASTWLAVAWSSACWCALASTSAWIWASWLPVAAAALPGTTGTRSNCGGNEDKGSARARAGASTSEGRNRRTRFSFSCF